MDRPVSSISGYAVLVGMLIFNLIELKQGVLCPARDASFGSISPTAGFSLSRVMKIKMSFSARIHWICFLREGLLWIVPIPVATELGDTLMKPFPLIDSNLNLGLPLPDEVCLNYVFFRETEWPNGTDSKSVVPETVPGFESSFSLLFPPFRTATSTRYHLLMAGLIRR